MKKVITLKTGKYLNYMFHRGDLHALPDWLADALLADRWAYPEGEDPPIDSMTAEQMERVAERKRNQRMQRRRLLASREEAKRNKLEKVAEAYEKTQRRSAELLAARRNKDA
jgi:hypothetical protein